MPATRAGGAAATRSTPQHSNLNVCSGKAVGRLVQELQVHSKSIIHLAFIQIKYIHYTFKRAQGCYIENIIHISNVLILAKNRARAFFVIIFWAKEVF